MNGGARLCDVLRGLQFKWTCMLACVALALAAGSEIFIRSSTERLVARQQAAACRDRCRSLASAARASLRDRDHEGLQRVADRFESHDSLLYIEFYSREGQRLITALQRDTVAPEAMRLADLADVVERPRLFTKVDDHVPYLDVVEPALVWAHEAESDDVDDLIGFVRVGIDLSDPQAEIGSYLQNVRSAGLLAALLVIPIAFFIVRRVTAPIDDLSRRVSQLAGGDFSVRAAVDRQDEIGRLAEAFNRMADELSHKNESLVKLNAELEDRVLDRTRQLKELASKDHLTGLYNRRHLGEVLSRRFAEAQRYDTDLSCLMIDLDNFKQVNDRFGHEVGDQLLALTAGVVRSELRESDVGARFGGDEFCVILPHTSAADARQIGLRITDRFTAEVKSRLGGMDNFGISIGVAGKSESNLVSSDALMRAADKARSTGPRMRVRIASSSPTRTVEPWPRTWPFLTWLLFRIRMHVHDQATLVFECLFSVLQRRGQRRTHDASGSRRVSAAGFRSRGHHCQRWQP